MKGNGDVFYCFVCSERKNKKVIATITGTVELLRQEISDHKSSLSQVQPLSEDDRLGSSANSQQALDSVVASGEYTNLMSATSNKSGLSTSNRRVDPDRKFNVVIYGIEEWCSYINTNVFILTLVKLFMCFLD